LIAAGVFLTAAMSLPSATTAPRVRVLVSQDAPPYEEALRGLRETLDRLDPKPVLDVRLLHGDAARARDAAAEVRKGEVDLLIALGSLATQSSVGRVPDVPIVGAMVLRKEDLQGAPNATGVFLEFPPDTEMRWLSQLLPGQKRVAVLFHSPENRGRVEEAGRAAGSRGLSLNARKVDSPEEIPMALENLVTRADVLWGIADPMVLTPQTAQPILLFSLRNRIPFIGLSETWVRAGALYALDRDYEDIGAQCGEMAREILRGTAPRALPPLPPRKVTYSVNLRTARTMRVEIPPDLLKRARSVVD
jgi:putative ABC transport system substrate-binding protein